MSGLSAQHEKFCHNIVKGMSQVDAYREAGYKGGSIALTNNAARLMGNDSIVMRIAELRANAAQKAELTVARFAKRLDRIASAAERALFVDPNDTETETLDVDKKAAADIARQCTMDAAKLLGLVVDKRENLNRNVNDTSELSREELLDIARAGRTRIAASERGGDEPDCVHEIH